MTKIRYISLFLYIGLIIGCGSSQNVSYLVNSEKISQNEYNFQSTPMYDARIMPKDILTITVTTTDPEAARPFNIVVPISNTEQQFSTYGQFQLNTYLVDNKGMINFPVLGMINLKGVTDREAEEKITELLKPYIREEPLVIVKFGNYKISVLGEVSNPGTFIVSQGKINIFEALAMAGDMTIYGVRNNVKIVREDEDGNKKIHMVNLNDPSIIFSNNYYLHQNDVVYVEPNKIRAKSSGIGETTSLWLSSISILITVVNLLISILK